MSNILAPHQACAPWCRAHLPATGGVVHIGAEQVVEVDEQNRIYVSVEQAPGEMPAVRVQGAYDAPMPPMKTMELVAVLQAAAFAAVAGQAVSR